MEQTKVQDSLDNLTKKDLLAVQRNKLRRKRYNCRSEGVPWSISFGDVHWPTHCPILGIELDYFSDKRADCSPTFDRICQDKGYIPGNVVVMSYRAHRLKSDGTATEHRLIANYIDNTNVSIGSVWYHRDREEVPSG